jgi:hypothetical protein
MIELQTSVKQDDNTRTRTPKPGYLNLSIISQKGPPPPHGKILKKGPDQYTQKTLLNVCLHITFILLTILYIYIYIYIYINL